MSQGNFFKRISTSPDTYIMTLSDSAKGQKIKVIFNKNEDDYYTVTCCDANTEKNKIIFNNQALLKPSQALVSVYCYRFKKELATQSRRYKKYKKQKNESPF